MIEAIVIALVLAAAWTAASHFKGREVATARVLDAARAESTRLRERLADVEEQKREWKQTALAERSAYRKLLDEHRTVLAGIAHPLMLVGTEGDIEQPMSVTAADEAYVAERRRERLREMERSVESEHTPIDSDDDDEDVQPSIRLQASDVFDEDE